MIWNIYTCDTCKRQVIAEEKESHQCKPLKEYGFENSILWINDGTIWYPLKTQQPKSNPEKTTDDETEPDFSIVLYYALRKSRYNGIRLRCFTSSQARKRS